MALPPAAAIEEAHGVRQLEREVAVQVELFDKIAGVFSARICILHPEIPVEELLLGWVEAATWRKRECWAITGTSVLHGVDGRFSGGGCIGFSRRSNWNLESRARTEQWNCWEDLG